MCYYLNSNSRAKGLMIVTVGKPKNSNISRPSAALTITNLHGLTWDPTHASALRGRRVAALMMSWSPETKNESFSLPKNLCKTGDLSLCPFQTITGVDSAKGTFHKRWHPTRTSLLYTCAVTWLYSRSNRAFVQDVRLSGTMWPTVQALVIFYYSL